MQPSTPLPTPESSQPPSAERLPQPIGTPEQRPDQAPERSVEQQVAPPSVQEVTKSASSSAPAITVLPQPIQIPVTDDLPSATSLGLPTVADDVDVIEKEWVRKAKAVVENTRDNPHKQNQQLTIVKTDYQKKRYGKDVKLADDALA